MSRRAINRTWMALLACSVVVSACTVLPKGRADLDVGIKERGTASWYGEEFHGWLTANGEIYDMEALTAAHRTLPLGTVVRVMNVENGRFVRVRINDRGPYLSGRILDLSRAAARKLDMMDTGVAAVQIEVLGEAQDDPRILRGIGGLWAMPFLSLVSSQNCAGSGNGQTLAPPRKVRTARMLPTDIMRERRIRRVADFFAADHRAYSVASLSII